MINQNIIDEPFIIKLKETKLCNRIFLLICCLLLCSFSNLLSFDQLSSSNQEMIQIRGFLYQLPDGHLILASQPDLKSCCLGKESLLKQQIFVQGDFKPSAYAVTLEGKLKIVPQYDSNGQLIQWYVLEEARLVSSSSFVFPWRAFIMLLGLLLLIIGSKNRIHRIVNLTG